MHKGNSLVIDTRSCDQGWGVMSVLGWIALTEGNESFFQGNSVSLCRRVCFICVSGVFSPHHATRMFALPIGKKWLARKWCACLFEFLNGGMGFIGLRSQCKPCKMKHENKCVVDGMAVPVQITT